MKKCRRCAKPATLHITEIRKGEVVEIHLCESCARDYLGQAEPPDPDSPDAGFAKLEDSGEPAGHDPHDDRVCPVCGITFREFRSQGRLGCPNDYVAFERDLIPLFENIHGEKQHCGKMPRRAPDSSRRQHELVRLRSELKAAIEEEDYEEAARLRDRIQAIESAAPSSGPED